MNPEQSPSGNNPYDFILNPAPPPKHSLLKMPGTNPLIGKLIAIIGGLFVVAIILAIIVSNLGGGTKAHTKELLGIVQTQNELVRVSGLGTTSAVQQVTRNLAITVNLSILTQEQQMTTYMAEHGHKVGKKEFVLKQNATTDQKLTTAKQTSTFDTVFAQTMQTQLQSYAVQLKQLFNTSTLDSERTLLSNDYTQAQLLISQIPSSESLQAD